MEDCSATPACPCPTTLVATTWRTSAGCWPTVSRFSRTWQGAFWNRTGLNRLKAALQPGDCVKVAALDRLGRSLTEVLELLGWLPENGVEIVSLRESVDHDSGMGRAMLHLDHGLRGDGVRACPGAYAGGAGARKGYWQAPRAVQGRQPEAGRGDTEHAPARRPHMGPDRHYNRIALQQHPPDLYLESRGDSAVRLRRGITWLTGLETCRMKNATDCGIKLREKLCSHNWPPSPTMSRVCTEIPCAASRGSVLD